MNHIHIGICTYKRKEKLQKLLEKLKYQYTGNCFEFSVSIVDNDFQGSAEDIVKQFKNCNYSLYYHNEKEKNIAKARNKVLEVCEGKYIAFIDDDEYPDDKWLYNHFITCNTFDADGTLGPVIEEFPEICPKWIKGSNVCKRKNFATGVIIKTENARTGNCFLIRENVIKNNCFFDVQFGLTGGEDIDFFDRLINKYNSKIVWCKEAVVFEPVADNRLYRKYYIVRALKRGGNSQRFIKKNRGSFYQKMVVIASIIKMISIIPVFPFFYIINEKFKMKAIESFFHHLGRILSLFKKE
jgi:succinoglycan biosynthesis protein ExoM